MTKQELLITGDIMVRGNHMNNEELIKSLDMCVPKNPKSEWGRWQRRVVDKVIKVLSKSEGDLISRQAVLNLKQTFTDNAGYETEYVDIEDIKELPPVEDKGEWNVSHTDIDELWATCSNCDEEVKMRLTDDYTPIFYNFCPNCGADMRGGKE